jgi:predicted metalloprotease with PDZ domain
MRAAMTSLPPVRYRVFPKSPQEHLFEVACTVSDPDPEGQRFALPAWVPGSYLIREFARHVVSIRAVSGRRAVALAKLDKHTWVSAPVRGPLTVTMEVYAFDSSVRGAFLDASRGFFNGAAVFLRPMGREQRRCDVDILRPIGARYRNWRVATAMRRAGARPYGFGAYRAADYDELIDHPVEKGEFTLASFEACGAPHDIAITGRHDADTQRLCKDLARLCEWQIRLFGEPAPMDRYVFLVTALDEGYGGLEHRASCALLCSRNDLPRAGVKEVTESYRTFLGLCSHEYFHTWNVKRIRPAAFAAADLARESYTGLLWAFEGITSYYDDLALVRSGLISEEQYLEILGRSITNLLRTGGRFKQTVAEASFDAWIKYYRQDENSPNSQVSYYLKGSLVAVCLDLLIRTRTRGRRSLDDVMRALWRRHGLTGAGVPEDGIERLVREVTGLRLAPFFDRALRSLEELPLKQVLASAGLDLRLRAAASSSDRGGKPAGTPGTSATPTPAPSTLGVRTAEDPAGVKLTHVLRGSAAQAAGLAPGDVIVALNGLKVSAKNFEQQLAAAAADRPLAVHAFRRDELLAFRARPRPAPLDTAWLAVRDRAGTRALRRRWLHGI